MSTEMHCVILRTDPKHRHNAGYITWYESLHLKRPGKQSSNSESPGLECQLTVIIRKESGHLGSCKAFKNARMSVALSPGMTTKGHPSYVSSAESCCRTCPRANMSLKTGEARDRMPAYTRNSVCSASKTILPSGNQSSESCTKFEYMASLRWHGRLDHGTPYLINMDGHIYLASAYGRARWREESRRMGQSHKRDLAS